MYTIHATNLFDLFHVYLQDLTWMLEANESADSSVVYVKSSPTKVYC